VIFVSAPVLLSDFLIWQIARLSIITCSFRCVLLDGSQASALFCNGHFTLIQKSVDFVVSVAVKCGCL